MMHLAVKFLPIQFDFGQNRIIDQVTNVLGMHLNFHFLIGFHFA